MMVMLLQDMWMYLSENDKFSDFGNEDALIWHETNIPYAVWAPTSTRTHSLTYYPTEVEYYLLQFTNHVMVIFCWVA